MHKTKDDYKADGFTDEEYAEWQSVWIEAVAEEIGWVVLAWMQELIGGPVLAAVAKRQLDAGEYGPLHPDHYDITQFMPVGWEPPTLTRFAKMANQIDQVARKSQTETS